MDTLVAVEEFIDSDTVIPVLNNVMRTELSGVVRYTHYSLVITGPNRLPLVAFMKAQAAESLLHAQQAGELLTGLGGHPDQGIEPIDESHDHAIENILRESIAHERRALALYRELLGLSEGHSVYIEEYARGQIGAEELHVIEMNKLLRDYTIG
ncbi:MAG TPA: ferritin-like domain-containing protein [Ilumatobacter sp.]|nr:ferritin-like domain-containing protein [Ilumatobacter sp.]